MTKTIGVDIQSSDYWAEKARSYIDALEGPYHRHRLNMVRVLMGDLSLSGRRCLDYGCGDGIFAEFLLSGGASVVGFDIDPQMIAAAQKRFAGPKAQQCEFRQGGIETLRGLTSSSMDVVFALNVLAYFTPAEESEFYAQCARIIRPGGRLLVTHSNELFDMYTFNRYTVAFFERNFSRAGERCDVTKLLTQPDRPDRKVFAVRENPLSYRYKLARYGFREQRQEFASLHPQPPLLIPDWRPDDINSRQYASTTDWPEHERWKLMFMCSMFGSHSVRADAGA